MSDVLESANTGEIAVLNSAETAATLVAKEAVESLKLWLGMLLVMKTHSEPSTEISRLPENNIPLFTSYTAENNLSA